MGPVPGLRALIATANFPPDAAVGSQRTVRLVRHLVARGWNVDVLTIAPESYRPGGVLDPALLEAVPDQVRVIRAPALRPIARCAAYLRTRAGHQRGRSPDRVGHRALGPKSRLRRLKEALSAALALPDREASWYLPAVIAGCRATREGPPDIVYSSGPPFTAHLVAGTLAAAVRRPWVADFRDPWARAPWRDDRFGFEKRAWALLERLVVTRADAVVFVTRTNARDFERHYGDAVAGRFHLVPNGCDPREFAGIDAEPDAERFVLLHAGSLYGGRTPAPLFRAIAAGLARGAIDPARFRLRLVGRVGIPGADLPGLVAQLGLNDVVEFVPHKPRREVLREIVGASALLVLQPVTRVAVPAKLYEYMAAGRPILGLTEVDSETAEILRQSPGNLAVPPDDEQAIENAIVTLLARGPAPRAVPDPALFDGGARAAELERVLLHAIASREPHARLEARPS